MKNIMRKFRMVALASLICVVVTALTGCFSLQEMKEQHAILQQDGNIRLGEHEYIEVELDENYCDPDLTECEDVVYITREEDNVPVLLSDTLSVGTLISKDKIFIFASMIEDNVLFKGVNGIYCRDDYYDIVKNAGKGEYVVKGYEYVYYNNSGRKKNRVLTAEETKAIEEIFTTVKGRKTKHNYEYRLITEVRSFSEPSFLVKLEYEINKQDGELHLSRIEKGNKKYEYTTYKVPKDKLPIIERLIKKAKKYKY